MYVTIFVTDWGRKTSLTKLVLKCSVLKQSLPNSQHKLLLLGTYEGYIEAAQNFYHVTIFVTDWGQKTSLTNLVLKLSVLKQSLPNSQHKLLLASQYEGFIEAAQNLIMYVTIFVTDWGQKTSLSNLVLKLSVLKQSLPNSQHKLFCQVSNWGGYMGRQLGEATWGGYLGRLLGEATRGGYLGRLLG